MTCIYIFHFSFWYAKKLEEECNLFNIYHSGKKFSWVNNFLCSAEKYIFMHFYSRQFAVWFTWFSILIVSEIAQKIERKKRDGKWVKDLMMFGAQALQYLSFFWFEWWLRFGVKSSDCNRKSSTREKSFVFPHRVRASASPFITAKSSSFSFSLNVWKAFTRQRRGALQPRRFNWFIIPLFGQLPSYLHAFF